MKARRILVLAAVVAGFARAALAFDITACNTIVPPNEIGTLQTDMSCGGAFVGVRLSEGASLDMNGHSITGPFPSSTLGAVECSGIRCTITSSAVAPGRIGGGDFVAVAIGYWTFNVARLKISNVDLHDARSGIQGAAYVNYPLDTRAKAENVTSHGHTQYGIWVARLVARDVSANNNGAVGLAVDRLKGTDLSASENYSGTFGASISAKNLAANDNATTGVRAVKVNLRDSSVLGNNGFGTGVDIASVKKPGLHNTICGSSGVLGGPGPNWGVCTND